MLATGARLGEACALRWSDVDFDRQLVSITGTVVRLPGKGLIISSTKTTTSNRVLRRPGWIAELLHARRDNAAKDLRPDVTPVFPAPLGGLRDRSNTGRGRSRAGSGVVPLDFLVVQAYDSYEFERMRVAAAADSDFVFVNLSAPRSARRCARTRSGAALLVRSEPAWLYDQHR